METGRALSEERRKVLFSFPFIPPFFHLLWSHFLLPLTCPSLFSSPSVLPLSLHPLFLVLIPLYPLSLYMSPILLSSFSFSPSSHPTARPTSERLIADLGPVSSPPSPLMPEGRWGGRADSLAPFLNVGKRQSSAFFLK